MEVPLKQRENYNNWLNGLTRVAVWDKTIHEIVVQETVNMVEGYQTADEAAQKIQINAEAYIGSLYKSQTSNE